MGRAGREGPPGAGIGTALTMVGDGLGLTTEIPAVKLGLTAGTRGRLDKVWASFDGGCWIGLKVGNR